MKKDKNMSDQFSEEHLRSHNLSVSIVNILRDSGEDRASVILASFVDLIGYFLANIDDAGSEKYTSVICEEIKNSVAFHLLNKTSD